VDSNQQQLQPHIVQGSRPKVRISSPRIGRRTTCLSAALALASCYPSSPFPACPLPKPSTRLRRIPEPSSAPTQLLSTLPNHSTNHLVYSRPAHLCDIVPSPPIHNILHAIIIRYQATFSASTRCHQSSQVPDFNDEASEKITPGSKYYAGFRAVRQAWQARPLGFGPSAASNGRSCQHATTTATALADSHYTAFNSNKSQPCDASSEQFTRIE
jgi:hypothetical protein